MAIYMEQVVQNTKDPEFKRIENFGFRTFLSDETDWIYGTKFSRSNSSLAHGSFVIRFRYIFDLFCSICKYVYFDKPGLINTPCSPGLLWIYQDAEKVTPFTLLIPQSMETALENGTTYLTRIRVPGSSFLVWNEMFLLVFIFLWVETKVHHMDNLSSEITATIWSSRRAKVVVRSAEETTGKNNAKYIEVTSSFHH